MKTKLSILLVLTLMAFGCMTAQVPQAMNYQAVARDAAGQELQNRFISLRLTIHDQTSGGIIVYKETDTATTNKFGLFSVAIGNGTIVSGTFSAITWSTGSKFLQVELDPAGGSNYADMGTSQLQSVPYALNSPGWATSGADIYNSNTGYVGIGTAAPISQLHVKRGYGQILTVEGTTQSWLEYVNSGAPIGYMGHWNGGASDFDIGTSVAVKGNFNLATQALPRLTIDSGGRVGIGVPPNPAHQIDMLGDLALESYSANDPRLYLMASPGDSTFLSATGIYLYLCSPASSGNPAVELMINRFNNDIEPLADNLTSMGTANYRWSVVYAGNGVIQTSDERLKKNIENLNLGLSAIMQLRPVSYEWKNAADGAGEKIGFIAQEVEKIIPQAVVHDHITDKEIEAAKSVGKPVPQIKDPYGMNYSEITPVLVKAVQELNEKNNTQQQQLEELKKQNEYLLQLIREFKN